MQRLDARPSHAPRLALDNATPWISLQRDHDALGASLDQWLIDHDDRPRPCRRLAGDDAVAVADRDVVARVDARQCARQAPPIGATLTVSSRRLVARAQPPG